MPPVFVFYALLHFLNDPEIKGTIKPVTGQPRRQPTEGVRPGGTGKRLQSDAKSYTTGKANRRM